MSARLARFRPGRGNLGGALTGAVAGAAVMWRQPMDRLRARLVRDVVIVTGLDATTVPFVAELARAGRASVVVIEPDAGHPLLDDVRAAGARVMIGQPALPRVLLPVIAGHRGCALRGLYALAADAAENEAVLAAARTVLGRRPGSQPRPYLVARIDDPHRAEHWRGAHVGAAPLWLEDALSAPESTAASLADELWRSGPGQVLLCGDGVVALAVLRELARRAWERRALAQAAAAGGAAPPEPELVHGVLLLDQRAEDLRREYMATAPPSIARALGPVDAVPSPWRDTLLRTLDANPPASAARAAVVVADAPGEDGVQEAGRAARLHPDIPVFVLTSGGAAQAGAISDRLQPYPRALLVGGRVPEDSWTRVARHWHECCRLRSPAAGQPWAELDDFDRQDSVLRLRSVMTAVAARGRRWVPSHAVAPGSFIELNDRDLAEVARAEHARWYRRRLAAEPAAVRRRGAGAPRSARVPVDGRVVPWEQLAAGDRGAAVESLRSQLAHLEDVGFMPVVPAGGPPGAAEFQRVGTVLARRLRGRRRWTRPAGGELAGEPGDWRVRDDDGDERTVRDAAFRASHEPIGGERWRRTGTCRAWRVDEERVLRTLEGRAVARPGDWVVEGHAGERWPVTDAQFRRTYRAVTGG